MKHVLVTGRPGVGKTTLCMRLFDALCAKCDVVGFLTEEVRRGREREGFDFVLLPSMQRVPLARQATPGAPAAPRVGKYMVDVNSIERCVVPFLQEMSSMQPTGKKRMFLIDEIGKMEMLCPAFEAEIRKMFLQRNILVVSTVALRGRGFIEEVKFDPESEVWEITERTRDGDFESVLKFVLRLMA